MSLEEALDDDYIVEILKRDAAVNKTRPGAAGFGLLPESRKRRADAPKPNTRFLKNLVREADSHNAALKAKEDEERRARFSREQRDGKRKREGGNGDRGEKRKRDGERPNRWINAFGGLDGQSNRRRSQLDHATERTEKEWVGDHRQSSNSRHNCDKRRHRDSRDNYKREDTLLNPRSASPIGRSGHGRRLQPCLESGISRSRSKSPTRHNHAKRKRKTKGLEDSGSDSDPSQTVLLGPAPPPMTIPRGRGAFRQSDIDSRFTSEYDPKTDVSLDQDNGDRDEWDMALEALRDRARWRAQGVDRLRAAGFTDEEVARCEKGGEKDVEDVQWSAMGVRREWDRGKTIDEDGNVDLKAAWAS